MRWGIDVEGRPMVYAPWPIDANGSYRSPDAQERKSTYAVSGEAVRETLDYFERCGGDTARLVALLNDHARDTRFHVIAETLREADRCYTCEYYFYFIMFTKKVIGRYDFHFGEDKNDDLSIHHRIFEKGFLEFLPFGEGVNDSSNNIPITVYDHYLPTCPPIAEFVDWTEALTRERGLSYRDTVFRQENAWIESELLMYLYEFFMVLTNIADMMVLIEPVVRRFKFMNLSFVPRGLLAKFIPIIVKVTTTVLSVEHRVEPDGYLLTAMWKRNTGKQKHSLYRRSVLNAINAVLITGFRVTLQNALGLTSLPAYELLCPLAEDPLTFRLIVPPDPVAFRAYPFFFFNGVIAPVLFMYCRAHPDRVPLGAALFVALNFLLACAMGYLIERKKNRLSEYHLANHLSDKEKYITELENLSSDLLAARINLEDKVAARTVEIERANERLREYDQSKTEFFYNVSHELRTPLTLIKAPLESILSGRYGSLTRTQEPVLRMVLRNVGRLREQVDALLEFARIDQKRITPALRPVNLAELCAFLSSELAPRAEAAGIRLKTSLPASPVVARLDLKLFERAFFNLALNALKFTPEGGQVTISVGCGAGTANVAIEDTGIGIPADKLPRIFERFAQVDGSSTRRFEGTGLGLALVKQACGILGASVEAKSEEGKGSTFTLTFPLIEEEAVPIHECFPTAGRGRFLNAEALSCFADDTACADAPSHKHTILVVEDTEDLRVFFASFLSDHYRVLLAGDGEEALSILRSREDIALVVTDIMMPRLDGRALYRAVREDRKRRAVPFLFITARVSSEEKVEALHDGAIGYIYKPFSVEEVTAKIDALLNFIDERERTLASGMEARIIRALRDRPALPQVERQLPLDALGLSVRELSVAQLVAEGKRNKEIAAALRLSEKTVAHHIESIYRKTGAGSRLEFMRRCMDAAI